MKCYYATDGFKQGITRKTDFALHMIFGEQIKAVSHCRGGGDISGPHNFSLRPGFFLDERERKKMKFKDSFHFSQNEARSESGVFCAFNFSAVESPGVLCRKIMQYR